MPIGTRARADAEPIATGDDGCCSSVANDAAEHMKAAKHPASSKYCLQCLVCIALVTALAWMPDLARHFYETPGAIGHRRRVQTRKRILILGGGFGGVHAARGLERLYKRDESVEIALVSRDNFFLYTPMLHEIASCELDITHIVSPLRTLLRRTQVVIGDVVGIDLPRKRVQVAHGVETHVHDLAYDQLIIALGSTTNFYGLPGLEEHAVTMKTLGDAIHLRNRLIASLEEADTECAGGDDGLLTFVVAGGGFAGVETLAAIHDFVRDAARFYPRIDPKRIRVVLVHSGERILPELGDELGAYTQDKLRSRGLEIITGARVSGVTESAVRLADGRRIQSRLLVWTAGTSPHALLGALPCGRDHGRLIVDAQLRVSGWRDVWALGDCALIPDRRTGRPHPPTAQHALREARVVARNVAATLRGDALEVFDFKTIGQLAAIGRRTGVARVFGINFSGFFAWWLWRTVYLSKLPRLEKKVRVAIDWTLDLIFPKDFVQFLTIRGHEHQTDLTMDAVESPRRMAR
jgi:NADH dehydrogenase